MRRIGVAVVLLLGIILTSCGGGSSSSGGTVTVTISPTTATVKVGATQQFSASVSHTSNTAVTWEVNSIVGGNATIGTVSTTGLYTAPASVPSPATVTVTAVSQADTAQASSASVIVAVPISIVPTTGSVSPNSTLQFSASVLTTNTNITWQVNGITGGNSTVGTISTTGLYTAPASVPNPNTIKITAISQADTTLSASANIQITPPPLTISPSGATILAGAQQTFTATALSQNVTPVWSIQCPSQAPGGCGSITAGGVFTAPLSPPPGGNVSVTAATTDGSALTTTTTITVQFAAATLSGPYAFAYSNQTSSGTTAEAGSITFDGAGNITGGSADGSDNGGAPLTISGGTYTVGVDGRGTATVQTQAGPVTWQLVVVSHSQAFMARMDAGNLPASGTLDLQQPTQFSSASITGRYALSLSGGTTSAPFAMVGSLAANGAGSFTGGLADVNNNGTVSSNLAASGTYGAPSGTGRGTLTVSSSFATQTFVYYQVDATRLKLVETDGARTAAGDLLLQPAGPFTRASFSGRFALTMSGAGGGAPFGMGGVFTLDGSSGIGNRVLDGVNQTVFDTQGSYFVTDGTSGRTTVNWTVNNGTILQYVMYPRNDGGFTIVEVDATRVAAGIVLPQTLSSPSVFSLAGSYATSLSGAEPVNASSPESITGQLVLTGAATFSGVLDVNDKGTITQAATLQAGSFTVDLISGRGSATVLPASTTLSGGTLVIYVLDVNRALILESDSARVLTGVVAKQF